MQDTASARMGHTATRSRHRYDSETVSIKPGCVIYVQYLGSSSSCSSHADGPTRRPGTQPGPRRLSLAAQRRAPRLVQPCQSPVVPPRRPRGAHAISNPGKLTVGRWGAFYHQPPVRPRRFRLLFVAVVPSCKRVRKYKYPSERQFLARPPRKRPCRFRPCCFLELIESPSTALFAVL